MKTMVIALGGNALQEAGTPATAQSQLEVVKKTAARLAQLAGGWHLAIVHGNGPQVGRIVLQNEAASGVTPAMPFDVCGAMSQGMIGYHIQQAMQEALRQRGSDRQTVTLVTQVVVDADDPGFAAPSKPIGPFYSAEEARAIEKAKGYAMKEDAGRGFRRVVASPDPKRIVEIDAVRALLAAGFIPVTAGGGGIPVIQDAAGHLQGTAAVIDKDLAAELLAEQLDADVLLILTAVEKVSLHYRTPQQQDLDAITPSQAAEYIVQGHFAPGSMLPKVEAAVRFAHSAPGRRALITSLEKAGQALAGKTGTTITQSL